MTMFPKLPLKVRIWITRILPFAFLGAAYILYRVDDIFGSTVAIIASFIAGVGWFTDRTAHTIDEEPDQDEKPGD